MKLFLFIFGIRFININNLEYFNPENLIQLAVFLHTYFLLYCSPGTDNHLVCIHGSLHLIRYYGPIKQLYQISQLHNYQHSATSNLIIITVNIYPKAWYGRALCVRSALTFLFSLVFIPSGTHIKFTSEQVICTCAVKKLLTLSIISQLFYM